MIEELKQVREALSDCLFFLTDEHYRTQEKVENALATLDRIIAEQTPDASKMVVPESDIFPREVWLAKGEHSKPLYQVENTKFSKVLYVRADCAAPTPAQPEKLDVEALKRSLVKGIAEGRNIQHLDVVFDIVSEAINIANKKGYIRAPLPKIEGLKEGLEATYRANKEWERQTGVEIPDTAKAVISAAESYLKASEV